MPKINHEEYEILKSLDDYWKWIARDKNGRLYKFQEKPKRVNDFQWNDRKQTWLGMSGDRFQFIQWEDEKPYNIAELIEEYESEEERCNDTTQSNAIESEETEVKNIEELKSWFENDKLYVGEYVKYKIDQLDEPDILSQELIDENKELMPVNDTADYYVDYKKLQNLLVPKQEEITHKQVEKYLLDRNIRVIDIDIYEKMQSDLEDKVVIEKPTISQEWFEIIKMYKENETDLWMVFDEQDIFDDKGDEFARAWLAYPNVEVEEEQKYIVSDVSNLPLLIKTDTEGVKIYDANTAYHAVNGTIELTEQEIKDYDERYFAFAVKVEELEE